jgi:dienelactone hydrolase
LACVGDLKKSPKVAGKPLGAIGFSNVDYFALWLAAKGDVQAGVSYYGALSGAGTDKSLSRFRQTFNASSSPVLILHGSNDSTVPADKAMELAEFLKISQSPQELHIYPGAEHRFDRDNGSANDAAASSTGENTRAFFKTQLQT